jgi:hypothetical protein
MEEHQSSQELPRDFRPSFTMYPIGYAEHRNPAVAASPLSLRRHGAVGWAMTLLIPLFCSSYTP